MSFVIICYYDSRLRFMTLARVRICRCQVKFPRMKNGCYTSCPHIIREKKFICFVINDSNNWPWASVLIAKGDTWSFSGEMTCIDIDEIPNAIFGVEHGACLHGVLVPLEPM